MAAAASAGTVVLASSTTPGRPSGGGRSIVIDGRTPTPSPTTGSPLAVVKDKRATPSVQGDTAPRVTVADQSANEVTTPINLLLTATDPDANDSVRFSVAGLPPGLSLVGNRVTGSISYTAANDTTNYRSVRTSRYTVSITATDSAGRSTTGNMSWLVYDTYRTMPNYFGKHGDGSDGPPSIGTTFNHDVGCAFDPHGDNHRVYWQSEPPGAVIPWNEKITFRYGNNDPSCPTYPRGSG